MQNRSRQQRTKLTRTGRRQTTTTSVHISAFGYYTTFGYLFHIRPLISKLTETFAEAYAPNRENAIDEGLIKFKGRLAFKQYMPLKPAKRGIKVWLRADSATHYVSAFEVYTGRPNQGEPELGLGARVVTDLSRDLVDCNYHLFFDNFFSTFALMKKLKQDGMYATATTHKNRKEFPTEVKNAKLQNRGDSFSMQHDGITACAWRDKKIVYFLTSGCQPSGDDTVQRRKKNGTLENMCTTMCWRIQQLHGRCGLCRPEEE